MKYFVLIATIMSYILTNNICYASDSLSISNIKISINMKKEDVIALANSNSLSVELSNTFLLLINNDNNVVGLVNIKNNKVRLIEKTLIETNNFIDAYKIFWSCINERYKDTNVRIQTNSSVANEKPLYLIYFIKNSKYIGIRESDGTFEVFEGIDPAFN